MKKFTICCFIIITSIFSSCGVTDTNDDQEYLQPGRRDYVWSTDTLNTSGGMIAPIWGGNVNDLWAINNGTGFDPLNRRIWHYDGIKWKKYDRGNVPIRPICLLGFSESDIWVGTQNGDILHYDGSYFEKSTTITSSDFATTIRIRGFCGTSSNDLYAVGLAYITDDTNPRLLIYHYNGDRWSEIYRNDFPAQVLSVYETNGKLYLTVTSRPAPNPVTVSLFQFADGKLQTLFSATPALEEYFILNQIGNELYFLANKKIYKINDKKLEMAFDFSSYNEVGAFFGRSKCDMFFKLDNSLMHYNGTDYSRMPVNADNMLFITSPAIFSNDIFICAINYENLDNVILHGHLNNNK